MPILGKRFQIAMIMAFGFLSILSFQNCSPLRGRVEPASLIEASCSGESCQASILGKNASSGPIEIVPEDAFCASVPNKELVYDIGFGDPLFIEIPFFNSCSGPVQVARLNLSENSSHLMVQLPNQEVAFGGQRFSLVNNTTTDQLLVRNVNNYGETKVVLNYSLTHDSKSILVSISVLARVLIPAGAISISNTKMTCQPSGIDPSTYSEAYQTKDVANNQWSSCVVYRCADDHYFNPKGVCEKLVIAANCEVDGEYRWGSARQPPCFATASGPLALGGTIYISNVASGYYGKLKATCQLWESERTVSQELGKGMYITVKEPTLMVDYVMGSDPNTSSICQPIKSTF